MNRPWKIWLVFALCLTVLLAALGWMTRTTLRLYERPDDPEYSFVMGMASVGSLLIGYVGVGLATLLCHHWRRCFLRGFCTAPPKVIV